MEHRREPKSVCDGGDRQLIVKSQCDPKLVLRRQVVEAHCQPLPQLSLADGHLGLGRATYVRRIEFRDELVRRKVRQATALAPYPSGIGRRGTRSPVPAAEFIKTNTPRYNTKPSR